MKKFTLGALGIAIAATLIPSAQADIFTVQEIETPENVRHLFPYGINDNRHSIVLGQFPLDIEIDLTKLTSGTLASVGINSEEDDLENYELSQAQYDALINRLRDKNNTQIENQRVTYYYAGYFNGQDVIFNEVFNDTDPDTPEMADSSDHLFNGLNNNNVRVGWGTAPYEFKEFTYTVGEGDSAEQVTQRYTERAFIRQAIWSDGLTTQTYAAPEQAYLGGETAMMDINDQNLAVGFASVALSPASQAFADTCEERIADGTATRSLYSCMWQRWFNLSTSTATNLQSFYSRATVPADRSIYDINAVIWQLDANGNVISSQQYPPLMERGEEDDGDFSSYAFAVNNNGIAVGQSWTYFEGVQEEARRIKMPALFIDGETLPVTESTDYLWGAATDINDENLVVGFFIKRVQGINRYVGFSYDIDSDTLTELPSFFNGSSTIPTAVNNQGVIVGTAEIDADLSAQRRRVGFMYESQVAGAAFINLNDAIACDSGYFIASAEGINANGEVVATGIVAEQSTDDNGETVTRQVAKTLIFDPVAGELNNCTGEEERIERQGAATGIWGFISMLLIGGLITVRRKLRI
ncbi:DUF3466 family protein [Pseudidiomarina insulisalsae]|uniref:DUF3466 domain-containing protein n=1 Tax=Pseudidiomarina insulisalsae TaxID=575789 RepID=A0A432YHC1_9GAMM|nr:DUF3466 family protein [Pseudidiomarina insulisalsae]RUO60305.1 hypothetical protein CWI71_07835 [Pseudidiomarina insulisalsae]